MFFIKSSLLFLLLLTSGVQAQIPYTEGQCLNANFSTRVKHPAFPFGLLEHKIALEKEACLVRIEQTQFKMFKNVWIVDVCRHPVHIKKDGGEDVLKREGSCEPQGKEKKSGPYCLSLKALLDALQDDGLVFAPGEKQDLKTEHGMVYCAYTVLNKYLSQGHVFNRYEAGQEGITPASTECTSCALPKAPEIHETPQP